MAHDLIFGNSPRDISRGSQMGLELNPLLNTPDPDDSVVSALVEKFQKEWYTKGRNPLTGQEMATLQRLAQARPGSARLALYRINRETGGTLKEIKENWYWYPLVLGGMTVATKAISGKWPWQYLSR